MALPNRKDIKSEWCWDLSTIFPTNEAALSAVGEMIKMTEQIKTTYEGRLCSQDAILHCLKEYESYRIFSHKLTSYGEFLVSVDFTDTDSLSISDKIQTVYADCEARLTFIELEISAQSEELLTSVMEKNVRYVGFIRRILKNKKHYLQPETEVLLKKLQPLTALPYNVYNTQKMADLRFYDFEADSKSYPLDYSLFEDCYEYQENTAVRRAANAAFYKRLSTCKNVTATAYNGLVTMEKSIAEMRNFASVFSYLLNEQEISEEIYNRHLDIMMEELAPVMRRYAVLLKNAYGLDEMTYADLKLPFPVELKTSISLEESHHHIKSALSVMGAEYTQMADKVYKEKRIDFVRNVGKSTGAFCETIYGVGPYILCTWQGQIADLFTVVHEIGHAIHFEFMHNACSKFDTDTSLYLLEAPSTFNELLLSDWLKKECGASERDVAAMLIGNTFYHNFVTHFLEAYYQREVYRNIERGESINADSLCSIYKSVLERFWGDCVLLNDGCELTWMRQSHYYYGLYSYTYSAGLSVAVAVWKELQKKPQETIEKWKTFLSTGLTKSPAEAVKVLGIDIVSGEHVHRAIELVHELLNMLA